jgi:hypothetical protein
MIRRIAHSKTPLKQLNFVILTKEESQQVAQQSKILRASERQIKRKILVVLKTS